MSINQTPLYQTNDIINEKKIWIEPCIEIIGENLIESGQVGVGTEGVGGNRNTPNYNS